MSLLVLSFLTLLALIVACIVAWCILGYFEPNIYNLREHLRYHPPRSPQLYTLTVGLKGRSQIDLRRLPGYLVALLLLHEDDRFYIHRGFNFPEIWVRVHEFIRTRERLRGGSSIPQQFVKSVVYATRRRRRRFLLFYKLREAAAVMRLESQYTKEEILQFYLQSVRLGGHHLYGFDETSKLLFNKSIYEIEFHEALFLCGLIPSPTTIFGRIYETKEYYVYPWGTAFTKTVDLLRMYLATWGRDAVYDLSSIRYEDVVKRFTALDEYSPQPLSTQEELNLEIRAHEILLKARACFHVVLDKREWFKELQRTHYSAQVEGHSEK